MARKSRFESAIYKDVKSAASPWKCSFDKYYENDHLCIDVALKDINSANWDEFYGAFENKVLSKWAGSMNRNMGEAQLAFPIEDE